MTRSLLLRLAPVVCAVALAACGATSSDSSSPSTSPSSPSTVSPSTPNTPACVVTVTGIPSSVPWTTGHYQFSISTSSSCSWVATSDVTWADVSPGSVTGSASPTLNVQTNSVRDPRTATITVAGQSFKVVQGISPCEYSVSPSAIDLSASGGVAAVNVSATTGCSWTASTNQSWIRPRISAGSGIATVQFDVDANFGSARQATGTVAGYTVSFTQQGR